MEYTCLRNAWRLPRYLIETSEGKTYFHMFVFNCPVSVCDVDYSPVVSSSSFLKGKFSSTVVVEGKDFKLHARGGFESKPSVARESAAAEMIAVMHNTFP